MRPPHNPAAASDRPDRVARRMGARFPRGWMSSTTVHIEHHADLTLVVLSGRLDGQATPACEAQVVAELDRRPAALVMDLAEVPYIASMGLRMILLVTKRLKQSGGRLLICALQPHAWEVFEISGFATIIPVHETRADALRAAGAAP